jgi:hypothetical protein
MCFNALMGLLGAINDPELIAAIELEHGLTKPYRPWTNGAGFLVLRSISALERIAYSTRSSSDIRFVPILRECGIHFVILFTLGRADAC